jgi:hypothetical protein
MDTRRWSTLWVFAGGCLTGAVLIGLHAGAGDSQLPTGSTRSPLGSSESQLPAVALAAQPAPEVVSSAVVPAGDTEERAPAATDTGNSVADVLGRLEAEYRQRAATPPASKEREPAGSDEPSRDAVQAEVASAVSEVTASKPSPSEAAPVAREPAPVAPAAVPQPKESPGDARVAALVAEPEPVIAAAKELPAPVALEHGGPTRSVDKSQQQMTAQIQQLTALQQATLVQQSAVLQYLQLLALSGSPPVARAWSVPRRRPAGGRIVPTLPSSISDTDNPWGFELQPSLLVR